LSHRPEMGKLGQSVKKLLLQTIMAAFLAAPLAVPMMEYTRLSTRSALLPEDMLTFSLPPIRLLGYVFPDFGGYHELMVYVGAGVLVLGLVAVLSRRLPAQGRFWFWVAIVTLVLAVGSYIPGMSTLVQLPGLDLLRVPTRSLFLQGMALAILAANGIEILFDQPGEIDKRRVLFGLAILCTLTIVMSIGVGVLSGEWAWNFIWGAIAILAVSIGVGARFWERLQPQIWFVALCVLAVIDLGLIDSSVLSFHPAESVLAEQQEVAKHLGESSGMFRVYSPSYSLPQHIAATHNLELSDGVDPMQLEAFASFMEQTSGVPRSGYSVTMPPFETGDPANDNSAYLPDPALLGLLNVRYVVSAFDLNVDGLALTERVGITRIYENLQALPRAWRQPPTSDLGEDIVPVEIANWNPNHIDILAEGPGLIVLSEIYYPGWRIHVDGRLTEAGPVAGILRGVELADGAHSIQFEFRPVSVYLGLGLCLFGFVWLGFTRSRK